MVIVENVKKYKVVMVGDASVGKTSLIFRLCEQKSLREVVEATIGVDLREHVVQIGDECIKLHIWDTAGQERFSALTQTFYRNADAIIIVYDVTNQKSFDNLGFWIENCSKHISEETVKVLVANKCDQPAVTARPAVQRFADEHKMLCFETSAEMGSATDNVEAIFFTIARILKSQKPMSEKQMGHIAAKQINLLVAAEDNSSSCQCQLL